MFYPFKDISMGGSFMRPWGYPEIAKISDHPAGPNRRITGITTEDDQGPGFCGVCLGNPRNPYE